MQICASGKLLILIEVLKKITYTSENDECQVENHQSQQQYNLSSVVLFALLAASLQKKKKVKHEAI